MANVDVDEGSIPYVRGVATPNTALSKLLASIYESAFAIRMILFSLRFIFLIKNKFHLQTEFSIRID